MNNEVTDRMFLVDDRLSDVMRQTVMLQIATGGWRVASTLSSSEPVRITLRDIQREAAEWAGQ